MVGRGPREQNHSWRHFVRVIILDLTFPKFMTQNSWLQEFWKLAFKLRNVPSEMSLRIVIKVKAQMRYIHSPNDCRGQCSSPVSEADSPQVTLAIRPAVGCHYFMPSPRLPSQLKIITTLSRYQFMLLDEQRHMNVDDLLRDCGAAGELNLRASDR